MSKKRGHLEALLAQTCAACDETFDTMQGLMAHQSTSRKCAWYKKGKLKAVFMLDADAEESGSHSEEMRSSNSESHPGRDDSESTADEDDSLGSQTDHELMFVPLPIPSASGCDAPAESSVEEVNKTAGRVVGEGRTMRDAWRKHFAKQGSEDADDGDPTGKWTYVTGSPNIIDESSLWEPFDSETDWEIASWCVKEGISQGAVDRFLNIPNVREKLGLSYHNMRALLQKVDSIPERAEWMEQWITFKDRPGEQHLIQFRDIIAAIRALLGNPAHADRIVYRPRRIFSDASRKNRIYTEMWTGKWWNAVQ
ncbi:uncharacterized protein B0H18DRAFT_894472, partial [Fomitopsis serialis]|uniref:uncharacterized protein n=1 Tax=Fomitopsis serialis TaxID=139415 RepID=UPI002008E114